VTDTSFYVRNMLLQYDKQLVTARRLARYRHALRLAAGEEASAIPADVKRKMMVERIAREVVENLILSGSDNPVVRSIKEELEAQAGFPLIFKYPPTELEMQIFRDTPEGPVELNTGEKAELMERLWAITLDKVDDTML
jgi:hypothetical protein